MLFFYLEFYKVSIFFLISFLLACIILFLSYQVSVYNPDVEKLSTYECGFDPYGDARNNFDVRFYLVGLLFLIFDLETIFFLPWSVSLSFLSNNAFWGMLDFIFELIVGFIYVWRIGVLDWE
jgi:NADH-quinone oxidoreductase subunit A